MNGRTNNRPSVLVADDDDSVRASLTLLLKQSGFNAIAVASADDALQTLAEQPIDLVLQDMNFTRQTTGEEGLSLLRKIKQAAVHVPVVLITAWGSIELAVEGMKAGASDFVTKPWNNKRLVQIVKTHLELADGVKSEGLSRAELDAKADFSHIIGEHPSLLQVLETVHRVATTDASVLILGESGTGKELIAQAIHRNSRRREAPMVSVNLSGVPGSLFESEMFGHVKGAFTDAKLDRQGYFQQAEGGSIFLDELGELQRDQQAKLLRVLQDHCVQPVGSDRISQIDFRVISATNAALREAVSAGEFREDLFYRLNLITLTLPPLRSRRSDIPLLARARLANVLKTHGLQALDISEAAMEWLRVQDWPGNVRELHQCIERAALLCGQGPLKVSDFESSTTPGRAEASADSLDGMTLEQAERALIERSLARHQDNISRVAEELGLSRAALYRRLEKYGLERD